MKKFENKKTEIEDAGGFMSYADLVKACSNFVPKNLAQEGWTVTLQKESFRIEMALEKAKKAGDTIEIEDNDVDLIKKFCVGFPWAMKHKDLVEFEEYVETL